MKTKASIIQDLLDKKLISAEDAVILLTPEPQPSQLGPVPSLPYIYPNDDYYPKYPPGIPFWDTMPYYTISTNTVCEVGFKIK